jgi:hypothetical protein
VKILGALADTRVKGRVGAVLFSERKRLGRISEAETAGNFVWTPEFNGAPLYVPDCAFGHLEENVTAKPR